MTKRIILVAIMCGIAFILLPQTSSAWESGEPALVASAAVQNRGWRRKGRRGPKRHYGYKNYGQYRRTQVGNRRYRLVRRYSWRDGVRVSRLVRLYY